MRLARTLRGLAAGTALAALAATAAAGDEVGPAHAAQAEKPITSTPPAAAPPEAGAPPAAAPAHAPAAWSRPERPPVTAGVIARAARSAKERETTTPPATEKRRAGRGRGGGQIISLEIDWNAAPAAP